MGKELNCSVRFGKQQSEGKALLETSEILFRGEFRLKIPFSTITSAKAVDGELRLQTADGLAIFRLGVPAEKWCDKILHPKSRIEFEAEFLREVGSLTKSVSKGKINSDAECIFFAADSKGDVGSLSKTSKSMQGGAALWIIYPKGQKHITENDVLAAGRKSGLKDVKVVGFSPTHTALKFVIPIASR